MQRGIANAAKAMTLVNSDAIEFHVAGQTADADLAKLLSQHPKMICHGCLRPDVAALLADSDLGLLLLQPVQPTSFAPARESSSYMNTCPLGCRCSSRTFRS